MAKDINLSSLGIAAAACFVGAKMCGIATILSMTVTNRLPSLPIILGSIWGLLILSTITLCSIDMYQHRGARRKEKELKEYKRLQAKYGPL